MRHRSKFAASLVHLPSMRRCSPVAEAGVTDGRDRQSQFATRATNGRFGAGTPPSRRARLVGAPGEGRWAPTTAGCKLTLGLQAGRWDPGPTVNGSIVGYELIYGRIGTEPPSQPNAELLLPELAEKALPHQGLWLADATASVS